MNLEIKEQNRGKRKKKQEGVGGEGEGEGEREEMEDGKIGKEELNTITTIIIELLKTYF